MPASVAEWIACSLVQRAAQDQISLQPKLAIHHCLPSLLIQCTPLLMEKVGVTPDATLRFTACKQVCRQENHPSFETQGEGHTKSKIGAISGPTKWTLAQ